MSINRGALKSSRGLLHPYSLSTERKQRRKSCSITIQSDFGGKLWHGCRVDRDKAAKGTTYVHISNYSHLCAETYKDD